MHHSSKILLSWYILFHSQNNVVQGSKSWEIQQSSAKQDVLHPGLMFQVISKVKGPWSWRTLVLRYIVDFRWSFHIRANFIGMSIVRITIEIRNCKMYCNLESCELLKETELSKWPLTYRDVMKNLPRGFNKRRKFCRGLPLHKPEGRLDAARRTSTQIQARRRRFVHKKDFLYVRFLSTKS